MHSSSFIWQHRRNMELFLHGELEECFADGMKLLQWDFSLENRIVGKKWIAHSKKNRRTVSGWPAWASAQNSEIILKCCLTLLSDYRILPEGLCSIKHSLFMSTAKEDYLNFVLFNIVWGEHFNLARKFVLSHLMEFQNL